MGEGRLHEGLISHECAWCYVGYPSYLVFLQRDLPDLAVPHKGSGYTVHTFSSPDPDDEVWREESHLLSDFPLGKGVGRLTSQVLDPPHSPPWL